MESSSATGDVSATTARRAAISVPSSSTTPDAHPFANDHARDTRAQPDLATALGEPGDERVGQALGAAFRETVAARGRGDREHVREARPEPVVGADVDVQAQAGEHAPRGFGLEQARREAARAAQEHAGDLQQRADADAQRAGRRSETGRAARPAGRARCARETGPARETCPRRAGCRTARFRSPRRARCRQRCRRRPGDSSRSGRVSTRRPRPADPAPGMPGWSRRTGRSRRRRRGQSRAASAPRCRARRPRAAGSPRAPAP